MAMERSFWNSIRKQAPGLWLRVENSAGSGMPDCVVLLNGVTCFVELKAMKTFAPHYGLSTIQRYWLWRWGNTGGIGLVLARVQDVVSFMVFQRNQRNPFSAETYESAQNQSDFVWNQKIDWTAFARRVAEVHAQNCNHYGITAVSQGSAHAFSKM